MTDATRRRRLEAVLDASGVADSIERALPVGVRRRQLTTRSFLFGVLLALADGRPAHLRQVHGALVSLPEADQWRTGVLVDWHDGPHRLTYRQVEYTARLIVGHLAKACPDGRPSTVLGDACDRLVEASVATETGGCPSSLAVDWTDVESYSTRRRRLGRYVDDEASWGHRRGGGPGEKDELFFGYYLQLATVMPEEGAAARSGELVRRMLLTSCHVDPPPAFAEVLTAMVASGVAISDLLYDSGYSHRTAEHWALPMRSLGAALVTDLHTADRGVQGTFAGAICHNGNLYCPSTPPALFQVGPLARGASREAIDGHDRLTTELARYRLGVVASPDTDGYQRLSCPAVLHKVACPLRDASMTLSHTRPEIADPPTAPPACCTQRTITLPPAVNAKTAQKHPWPSAAHRRSYARRAGAERSNATLKDPATNDIARGWCRLMGLAPMALMLGCLVVVRNLRVSDAFETRQAAAEARRRRGLPPRHRSRRRTTVADLVASAHDPP